jgi:hypothetical protein
MWKLHHWMLVLLTGLALLMGEVKAKAETAAEMLSHCASVLDGQHSPEGKLRIVFNFETGKCVGAFTTFMQAIGFLEEGASRPVLNACPPVGALLIQFVAIFDAYARRHPERWREPFFLIALSSVQEAFPCR